MRVIWERAALADLSQIAETIAENNPAAARKVVRHIQTRTRSLGRFPNSRRVGRVEGTRELVISGYPYIVAYQVDSDTVRVLAVVHTARRWPESFLADRNFAR